ncbi:MAG: 50S ribosomal protein L28 [Lentisphaerae bacterium GWF2_44_16]|nr:MAG: 50S ribosomal protein L28 [Lentisphaerae bacterium GWF2_44_16]
MSNVCAICGKKKFVGGSITRRGLAKKKGGIGMHVVKNNKRIFTPNIQEINIKTEKGSRKMKVCTACIRSNKIQKS